jgi:hypothetical protein
MESKSKSGVSNAARIIRRVLHRQRRVTDGLLVASRDFAEIGDVAGVEPAAEREHLRATTNASHARCGDAAARKLADEVARTAGNMRLMASGGRCQDTPVR